MNTTMTMANGAFGWALEASWQAAVLAVLVLLVQLALGKRLSPAWRYGLWLLVVARLVMPVSPQSGVSIFNLAKFTSVKAPETKSARSGLNERTAAERETESTLTTSRPMSSVAESDNLASNATQAERQPRLQPEIGRNVDPHSSSARVQEEPISWFAIARGIWIAGVSLLGTRLVWATFRFRSRLARGICISDANINRLLADCARILGVREGISIIETKEVASPAVWGLWRKRLLLPGGAVERFTTAELRHIFLHELAHVKRRDLEVNCLVSLLQMAHWFNPVLWLAFARMRADRELATDALALARGGSAGAAGYGETILKVLEGLVGKSRQPGLVGIAESKARMKERIVAIAAYGGRRTWRWAAVMSAVVLAGIGLTSARQNREPASRTRTEVAEKSFAIRVLDYDSGKPLNGVDVRYDWDYYSGNSKKEGVRTDADGRATIQLSREELKHLAYHAHKTNYLSIHGEWFDQQLSSLTNDFEIKLPQGTEIGGTITDSEGKPVAGAEISWDERMNLLLSASEGNDWEYAREWETEIGERITTTDSKGEWKAKCVWPTTHWAAIRAHHPDFADATWSTGVTSAMEAEAIGKNISFDDLVQRRGILKLGKGVTVKGRVVNEAGEPLPEIQVSCYELQLQPHAMSDRISGKRSTTTDSNGNFQFEHVSEKLMYYLVQSPGYGPAVAEVEPKGPAAEIELRLMKGRKFVGQVVDSHENPISGAHVKIADFSIWRGLNWETTSDDLGRIEWADAPVEKFEVVLEKNGFITQQRIAQAGGDKAMKIRMSRTLKITANILDADSKRPVQEFRIQWLDRGDPKDFEQGYPYYTIPGSNGVCTLDLGKLHSMGWYRGYAYDCVLRVVADGYAPVMSRVFSWRKGDVGDIAYDLELKPAPQIEGRIVDSSGHPVAGAQVALKIPSSKLLLSGETSFAHPQKGTVQFTDTDGKFRLNSDPSSQGIVAVHTEGFAQIGTNALSTNLTIRLESWGQLKGSVWSYDAPVTNQDVYANLAFTSWPESLRVGLRTTTDAQGQFTFNFVPPGKYSVYRMIPNENGASSGAQENVRVQPGATAMVKIGGTGRPVIGRFKISNPYLPIDWPGKNNYFYAHTMRPKPPEGLKSQAEFEAWRNRPEIQRANDAARDYPIGIAADGSFRIDEVTPGKYEMQIQIYDPRDPEALAYSKYICQESKSFEVPESTDKTTLDIGVIELTLKADIKKGETVGSDFEAIDMADKKFKLSDFRGKYVLLDFWATWCGPCVGEIPYLKQVHEKFKGRENFVMISLSLDKSVKEPREFLKKNELPWVQGYLGEWSETKVPGQYGVQGIPAIFLIGPDGKVIETELEGSSIAGRIEKHLK